MKRRRSRGGEADVQLCRGRRLTNIQAPVQTVNRHMRTIEHSGTHNRRAVDGDDAPMIPSAVVELMNGVVEKGGEEGGGGEGSEGGEGETYRGDMEEERPEVVVGGGGGHVEGEDSGVGGGEDGEGGAFEETEPEVGGHDGVGEEVVSMESESRHHLLELQHGDRRGEADPATRGGRGRREDDGEGEEEEEGEPRRRHRRAFGGKSLEKTVAFVASRIMRGFCCLWSFYLYPNVGSGT